MQVACHRRRNATEGQPETNTDGSIRLSSLNLPWEKRLNVKKIKRNKRNKYGKKEH
jgi:hypothetical protein